MKDTPITYTVLLARDATDDLQAIYDYISVNDSPANAEYVVDQIEQTSRSLNTFPERGVYSPELLEMGNKKCREIFFKPYRIIYRIQDSTVYIMMIADGRRDLLAQLRRRLLK